MSKFLSYFQNLFRKMFIFVMGEGFFNLISGGLRRYSTNTAWGFFGRFFSLGVAFFVSVYVVRYLGPRQYGLLSYSVSFVGLFGFMANLGLDTILCRDLVKYPEKRDELLGTAFFLKFFGSLVAIFLILLISWIAGNDLYTTFLIAIIALSVFIRSPIDVINIYFQAKVLAKLPVILSLFINGFLSLLKVVLVLLDASLVYFVLVFFMESIITFAGLIYIYTINKLRVWDWRVNPQLAKELLTNSWPLVFAGVFILIYSRIDQVIIKYLMDESAVGIYDVGVRLSEVWYFIPSMIVGSLFPAIVNAKKVDEQLYQTRMSKLYSLLIYLSLIIVVPVFLLADRLVILLYGEAFIEAANVIRIYAWTSVATAIGTVVNYYLINENYTKLSLFSNFFGMLINVLLNIILIPIYGIFGAALATLISYFFIPISVLFFKKTRDHGFLILRAFIFK